ncbi:hypothetical protein GGE46_000432 [Rhizobium etli]|uniref:Uncharacterized protein n=1 Tax=Rhizobium etli TaxID=29449 RepID=A0A7W6V5D0_RHIET|nr:hypothetical protein [Rhizobium etli]MBB4533723.1 hypothetical protein [Rhizobium etli]
MLALLCWHLPVAKPRWRNPLQTPSGLLPAQRHEYVDALRGTIKPGNFVKAEISSVVLLDPEKQIYAYCTRTTERSNPNWSYIGLTLKDNMIVDLAKNVPRCHDKRLRYYDFPELRNMKY